MTIRSIWQGLQKRSARGRISIIEHRNEPCIGNARYRVLCRHRTSACAAFYCLLLSPWTAPKRSMLFFHERSQWANRWMKNWFLRVFDPCIGGRALWNYIVVECDNGIEYDNGIEPAAAILLCKFFHIDKQWFFLPIAFMNKSLRHTSDCCMDFYSGIGRIFALSCASRHG